MTIKIIYISETGAYIFVSRARSSNGTQTICLPRWSQVEQWKQNHPEYLELCSYNVQNWKLITSLKSGCDSDQTENKWENQNLNPWYWIFFFFTIIYYIIKSQMSPRLSFLNYSFGISWVSIWIAWTIK